MITNPRTVVMEDTEELFHLVIPESPGASADEYVSERTVGDGCVQCEN